MNFEIVNKNEIIIYPTFMCIYMYISALYNPGAFKTFSLLHSLVIWMCVHIKGGKKIF